MECLAAALYAAWISHPPDRQPAKQITGPKSFATQKHIGPSPSRETPTVRETPVGVSLREAGQENLEREQHKNVFDKVFELVVAPRSS